MTPTQDIFPTAGEQDVIGGGDLEQARRVDVMFVIDRSGSMADDHEVLRQNIEALIPRLEEDLKVANVDCRIGLLTHDVSLEWPWLDLTPGAAAFREKLGAISPSQMDEGTPQAIDYAIEHANWDPQRRPFMVVMTDEPAEGGLDCSAEQFDMVLSKLAAKGIALLFIASPECFGDQSSTRIYDRIRDYPCTFVSDRLREDRGEKLIGWLAHSISSTRKFSPPQAAGPIPTDIFGMFDQVTRL